MKNLIRKILRESRKTKFLVEPGHYIYIRKVNEQLMECDPSAYSILRGLEGSICQVLYIDEDVNLVEIGTTPDGKTWCEDYYGWGMLITSDKITSGHNGYGNTRCGDNNCYWVNQFYVDFETVDSSFNTEDIFNQLYEQEEEGEFDWVGDILNEEVPKWVRITAGLRFKIPTIERYKEWQITNGQIHPESQWQKIKSIEYVDGIKCYVYDFAGYKNMITPIADFNEEEDLSYGDLKPRYLNRDRDNPKFSIIKKSNT